MCLKKKYKKKTKINKTNKQTNNKAFALVLFSKLPFKSYNEMSKEGSSISRLGFTEEQGSFYIMCYNHTTKLPM